LGFWGELDYAMYDVIYRFWSDEQACDPAWYVDETKLSIYLQNWNHWTGKSATDMQEGKQKGVSTGFYFE